MDTDDVGRPRHFTNTSLFGCNVGKLSPTVRYACVTGLLLVSSIVNSLVQERVFSTNGFHFGGFALLITSLTYALCASIELKLSDRAYVRKATLVEYLKLSALTLTGMYLTNLSLRYIDYATRILVKCTKLIPTMMLGTVMQGKRYRPVEYARPFVLITGVALFALGDSQSSEQFSLFGILVIGIATLADCAASNFEE